MPLLDSQTSAPYRTPCVVTAPSLAVAGWPSLVVVPLLFTGGRTPLDVMHALKRLGIYGAVFPCFSRFDLFSPLLNCAVAGQGRGPEPMTRRSSLLLWPWAWFCPRVDVGYWGSRPAWDGRGLSRYCR